MVGTPLCRSRKGEEKKNVKILYEAVGNRPAMS